LASAVEYNPNSLVAHQQLELIREVLRFDTSLRGLSRTERADRSLRAFQSAWQRLNSCATQSGITFARPNSTVLSGNSTQPTRPGSPDSAPAAAPDPFQLLYNSGLQRQSGVTQKTLREDSGAVESTMQYVFEVERTTASVCSQMNVTDQALLMLAQHENEAQK
jgi:hypothetical protein